MRLHAGSATLLLLLAADHLPAPATCTHVCDNTLVTETDPANEDPNREYVRMRSVSYPTTVTPGATFTVSGQATPACNQQCSGCAYRSYLGIEASPGCGGNTESACCTQDWNDNAYAPGVAGQWHSLACSQGSSPCTYSAFTATFTAPSTPGCYPLRWESCRSRRSSISSPLWTP